MPWTAADAKRHTEKADTPKKQETWAKVANAALTRCKEKGQGDCDARAIKQANAVIARMSEARGEGMGVGGERQGDAGTDICVCPKCGAEAKHERGTPCAEMKCPKCGAAMTGKTKESFDDWFDELDDDGQAWILAHVHGLKSALESERELRKEAQSHIREVAALLGEATKTDGGKVYTASDYLYVPDPDKPSEWKLRISEYVGGKKQITAKQVGRAIAAFSSGGFRGKKVQIPSSEVGRIKARLRSLWKKYNPDADPDEMPSHIKETEGQDFSGDVIPLVEKSIRADGTMPVKIIGPGWGSSGYYGPDVLERDGPKVFRAGTKMFWDHPTADEESARPEGSLRDLAAELAGNAYWDSGNIMGPGLYADAKVFSPFRNAVNELAPHIGVSIRGVGKAMDGEAEGREGPIIEEISTARSVDFVTMPGAGGKILQLFEAAGRKAATDEDYTGGHDEMKELEDLKEAKKQLEADLQAAKDARIAAEKAKTDAETETAKLKEAVLLREAKDFVSGKLAEAELPDLTKDRLVESLSLSPPVKDGALDEDAYAGIVAEAVKAEAEYLAKVLGSGRITGMGAGGSAAGTEEGHQALKESFKAKFESEGASPEEAERMAEIAASGR
jgi:hypothetical protein